jgi:predicted O-linked N-acetylglucosamine transferase (SPINDLY family)
MNTTSEFVGHISMGMTIDEMMERAERLRAGDRFVEAEEACKKVLARKRSHAGAKKLLEQLGPLVARARDAEKLVRDLSEHNPGDASCHVNLADVMMSLGKIEEAVCGYCRGLMIKADLVYADFKLGRALAALAESNGEGKSKRKAQTDSNDSEVFQRLSRLVSEIGRREEALYAYRAAVQGDEEIPDAFNTLGNFLVSRDLNDEALRAYARAIQLKPDEAMFHYNRGIPLKALGRWEECEAAYRKSIELRPDYAEAMNNLGILLLERGRGEESVAILRRAIEINPEFAGAFHNLGNSLRELGRAEEALVALRRATALHPHYPGAYNTAGIALLMMGRVGEAMESYRKALSLSPTDVMTHSNLLFAMHFSADCDAEAIYKEARAWDEQHGKPLRRLRKLRPNDRNPERRLRVGYVSPDLGKHVVGYNLLPLLAEHDPEQVETYCYNSLTRPDEITAQLKAESTAWREVAFLSDEQLAEQVRADAIDILVDLSLFTGGNRLRTFAMVPAPVQITYLGYCSTSGVDGMHYRFSDPHLDPPDAELKWYSEETIRLPETYWCYSPGGVAPDASPLPADEKGFVTFGCLNQFPKDSNAALNLWWEILKRVQNSRMIVHAPPGEYLKDVQEKIKQADVDPARVEFVGRQSWDGYMRTCHRIDIGLDPFPYNGGITTCDMMWMGVPIVSLSGGTAVGRGGRSILCNVGLPELVAYDREQYAKIAAELAADLGKVRELRKTLRERMKASPLMNAPRFAKHVEAAYRQTWRKWCANGSA